MRASEAEREIDSERGWQKSGARGKGPDLQPRCVLSPSRLLSKVSASFSRLRSPSFHLPVCPLLGKQWPPIATNMSTAVALTWTVGPGWRRWPTATIPECNRESDTCTVHWPERRDSWCNNRNSITISTIICTSSSSRHHHRHLTFLNPPCSTSSRLLWSLAGFRSTAPAPSQPPPRAEESSPTWGTVWKKAPLKAQLKSELPPVPCGLPILGARFHWRRYVGLSLIKSWGMVKLRYEDLNFS